MFTRNFSRRLARRCAQAGKLLCSPEFLSYDRMGAGVRARYSCAEEVGHYEHVANEGLRADEENALRATGITRGRALVVGCGAGREAFALERRGFEVVATDAAPGMVQAARARAQATSSAVAIHEGTWPDGDQGAGARHDLILVTASMTNHIPGRANRVAFFAGCARRLAPGGALVFFPDQFDLRASPRFFLASVVLRARSLVGASEWEPGDTVRAYLGDHAPGSGLVYYHYYASRAEVERELASAGLAGTALDDGFWVARPAR